VLTAAAIASFTLIPGYHARLGTAWNQTRVAPARLGIPLDAVRMSQFGQKYWLMKQVKAKTFEDAIIVVTDDPADPPELRSILWCAYYLYPRVLVQESALRADPELEADFVITTPHFVMGLPDSVAKPKLGLVPLSDRAREYATRWTQ